jgi:hypothetical protein
MTKPNQINDLSRRQFLGQSALAIGAIPPWLEENSLICEICVHLRNLRLLCSSLCPLCSLWLPSEF